jgi:putative methyltransferase
MYTKRRVYFNEYNVPLAGTIFLPIVSGLLKSNAEVVDELQSIYQFMPFAYKRDSVSRIVDLHEDPAVAAFSVSMWNEQLSLRVARQIKERNPDCLVVFGGPQVPHYPVEYFQEHPFIDVAVRGEGEDTFVDILTRYLNSNEFADIGGVSWRNPVTGECVINPGDHPLRQDLDDYPSPYLNGTFDDIIANLGETRPLVILETNRGCPFKCTFCYWGKGGLDTKFRYHSIKRVAQELEWVAQREIKFLYLADSNFGMIKRDREIAAILVDLKRRYGYPEIFHTNFGKNTDDKIFDIGVLLHENNLLRAVTMARQSNNSETLRNVKRANIKMSTYYNLQSRFNAIDVPTYSELILGLPGETYESWVVGMEELLELGLENQIFVYLCVVLPNTELGDSAYREKFGIVTQRAQVSEFHGAIRKDTAVVEYEDIVVQTDSMPVEDWRKMCIFSWMAMLFHSLKLGFYLLTYLRECYGIGYTDLPRHISESKMSPGLGGLLRRELAYLNGHLDRFLDGNAGCLHIVPGLDLYWHSEEASFLRLIEELDEFYVELVEVVAEFLDIRDVKYDRQELEDAIRYQHMRVPTVELPAVTVARFEYNFPEYFEPKLRTDPQPLSKTPQILQVFPIDYQGDKIRYSHDTILRGRKGGALLNKAEWSPAAAHDRPSREVQQTAGTEAALAAGTRRTRDL